jgi:DNA-binding Lrp family transcriptional regulator
LSFDNFSSEKMGHQEILTALLYGPKTQAQLAAELGVAQPTLSVELADLVEAGAIERVGPKGRGRHNPPGRYRLGKILPEQIYFEFGQKIGLHELVWPKVPEATNVPKEKYERVLVYLNEAQKRSRELTSIDPNGDKWGQKTSEIGDLLSKADDERAKLMMEYLEPRELKDSLTFIGASVVFAIKRIAEEVPENQQTETFLLFSRGLERWLGNLSKSFETKYLAKVKLGAKGADEVIENVWREAKTKYKQNKSVAEVFEDYRKLDEKKAKESVKDEGHKD